MSKRTTFDTQFGPIDLHLLFKQKEAVIRAIDNAIDRFHLAQLNRRLQAELAERERGPVAFLVNCAGVMYYTVMSL